ncbi:TetR/AcrR family transcriptional regulator [Granulicella sp. dw_53]|uniref:TetR/AcrR family transcriptional regulator n=1 Tax=Granulicella sp. dw_53 TaxID=2719792 RepID=UPI001BD3EFB4|nr:TetR/AcrR family transcriptional regulator [Granulicella sp. dw_53]
MARSIEGLSKGEKSRRLIIEKAAVLFNQKGYEGCSMQDVVKVVGLEKGTIYGHFESKEQLALEAFDFAWSETRKRRFAKLDTVANAIDKLKLHIRNFIIIPDFPGGCPLLNTAIDVDDGSSPLKREAKKAFRGWRDYLVGILHAGQEAKEVRMSVDPRKVATLIISMLEGASAMQELDRQSNALADAEEHLVFYLESVVRYRK